MIERQEKINNIGNNIKKIVKKKEAFNHYINNYINIVAAILIRVDIQKELGVESEISYEENNRSVYTLEILEKVNNILLLIPESEDYIVDRYNNQQLNPECVFTEFIDKYETR